MKKLFYILVALLVGMQVQAQTVLTLEDCRDMAVQNDVCLKNADLDLLAARVQKQEAFAEYFPKVSISSFGFWSLDPMLEIGVKDILGENELSDKVTDLVNEYAPKLGLSPVYSTLKYGYSASITAMQPLFAGGRIVTGNRLAQLGVEAAQLQKGVALRDRLLNVESTYWQIVALEEKLKTLNELSGMVDTLYNNVTVAVEAGVAVDTDLMQVKLKQIELKNGIVQLLGGLRLAKMNLFNTIGQEYCMTAALADSSRPFIDNVTLADSLGCLKAPAEYYIPEEEMLAGVDEVQLLDVAVQAKSLEKRMALGEALPQIAVGASYGYSHVLNSRFNGTAFAVVQIPLSDWGKITRKMERMDLLMEKAQNDRGYYTAQLLLQIRQLWLSLNVAWDAFQLSCEKVECAELIAERKAIDYDAGLITLSDLLQAQTALQQAVESRLEAQIAYSTALSAYQARQ